MSRFSMTSWPATLSLLYRQYAAPASHGIPCPDISMSFMSGRTLPQDESSQAHTPSRFDSHRSMASRELSAIPMKDGFNFMQSSSGNCCPPVEEVDEPEPRRRLGLSEARRRADVGSEPCLCSRCGGGVRLREMNSYRPFPPVTLHGTLPLRPELLRALGEGILPHLCQDRLVRWYWNVFWFIK